MGREARARQKRRAEVIHVSKFAGGRMSAKDYNTVFGVRMKCLTCSRAGVTRIRVLVQLSELMKRQPELCAHIMATNPHGPYVPTIPTKHGPMVMVSQVAACDACRPAAERTAAKGPSWAIVDIASIPKDNITVAVPS